MAVAVLIIAMLVFIIIYILSLPPEDRERLLNMTDDTERKTIRITVEVDEFFFDPDEITVDKRDRVIITFVNVGERDLECEIPEFDEETGIIESDEIGKVDFIANKRGTFTFFCSVEGRSGKVRGVLEVE